MTPWNQDDTAEPKEFLPKALANLNETDKQKTVPRASQYAGLTKYFFKNCLLLEKIGFAVTPRKQKKYATFVKISWQIQMYIRNR